MIESKPVPWTVTLPFYRNQDIYPQLDLGFTVSNIV